MQQLLLGINADVNYDLPQAAARDRPRTGDLAGVHTDFDAVNDVLAKVSVGVLAELDLLSHWTSNGRGHSVAAARSTSPCAWRVP